MSLLTMLRTLSDRVYSAELTAAAWMDDRRATRRLTLRWAHAGIRPDVPIAVGVIVGSVDIVVCGGDAAFLAVTVAITAVLALFSRIADKAHLVEGAPCPYCPPRGDGQDGNGGGVRNDGFPTAPPPMSDYDDDQIRAMAGDLDVQHFALVQGAAS